MRRCTAGAAALSLGSIAKTGHPAAHNGKPNIVFILIDDLGWKDVGFMGSEYYETPNVDRLAHRDPTYSPCCGQMAPELTNIKCAMRVRNLPFPSPGSTSLLTFPRIS